MKRAYYTTEHPRHQLPIAVSARRTPHPSACATGRRDAPSPRRAPPRNPGSVPTKSGRDSLCQLEDIHRRYCIVFRLHGAQRSVPFQGSVPIRPEMRICFGLNLVLGDPRLKIMVRRKSYLTRQQLRKRFSNHRFLAYINEEMNIFCDTLQGLSP